MSTKNNNQGSKKICSDCSHLFGLNYSGRVVFCNGVKGKMLDQYSGQKDLLNDFYQKEHDCPLSTGAELFQGKRENSLLRFRERFRSERIYLYLGSNCNNDCLFCYRKKQFSFFDKQRALSLIKKAAPFFKYLVLLGGEPLISPHIEEIMESASQRKIKTVLITNGRKLNNKHLAQKILSFDLASLTISLHSHQKKVHDLITQRKGSFNETVFGIKNALKINPLVPLRISIVINKTNYLKLEELASLAVLLGAKEIRFTCLRICPAVIKNKKKIFVSLKKAAPFMEKAFLRLERFNFKNWFIDGVPLCPFQQKFWPHFLNERKMTYISNEYNQKEMSFPTNLHPLCLPCSQKEKCPGIYTNQRESLEEPLIIDFLNNYYIKDLSPIKNRMIKK